MVPCAQAPDLPAVPVRPHDVTATRGSVSQGHRGSQITPGANPTCDIIPCSGAMVLNNSGITPQTGGSKCLLNPGFFLMACSA